MTIVIKALEKQAFTDLLVFAARAAGYVVTDINIDGSAWVYHIGANKDQYGDPHL